MTLRKIKQYPDMRRHLQMDNDPKYIPLKNTRRNQLILLRDPLHREREGDFGIFSSYSQSFLEIANSNSKQ